MIAASGDGWRGKKEGRMDGAAWAALHAWVLPNVNCPLAQAPCGDLQVRDAEEDKGRR